MNEEENNHNTNHNNNNEYNPTNTSTPPNPFSHNANVIFDLLCYFGNDDILKCTPAHTTTTTEIAVPSPSKVPLAFLSASPLFRSCVERREGGYQFMAPRVHSSTNNNNYDNDKEDNNLETDRGPTQRVPVSSREVNRKNYYCEYAIRTGCYHLPSPSPLNGDDNDNNNNNNKRDAFPYFGYTKQWRAPYLAPPQQGADTYRSDPSHQQGNLHNNNNSNRHKNRTVLRPLYTSDVQEYEAHRRVSTASSSAPSIAARHTTQHGNVLLSRLSELEDAQQEGDWFYEGNPCYYYECSGPFRDRGMGRDHCTLIDTLSRSTPKHRLYSSTSTSPFREPQHDEMLERTYIYVFPTREGTIPESFQRYVWWLKRNQTPPQSTSKTYKDHPATAQYYLNLSPTLLLSEYLECLRHTHHHHPSCHRRPRVLSDVYIHGLHFNSGTSSFLLTERETFWHLLRTHIHRNLKHVLVNLHHKNTQEEEGTEVQEEIMEMEMAIFIYEGLFEAFKNTNPFQINNNNNISSNDLDYLEECAFHNLFSLLPPPYLEPFFRLFALKNNPLHTTAISALTSPSAPPPRANLANFFSFLLRLDVSGSHSLRHVNFVKQLPFLECLNVSHCYHLTCLIDDEETEKGKKGNQTKKNEDNEEEEDDIDAYDRLKYRTASPSHPHDTVRYFTRLKILRADRCPHLRDLSVLLPPSSSVAPPSNTVLEELTISRCVALSSDHLHHLLRHLPRLSHLDISGTTLENDHNHNRNCFLHHMPLLHVLKARGLMSYRFDPSITIGRQTELALGRPVNPPHDHQNNNNNGSSPGQEDTTSAFYDGLCSLRYLKLLDISENPFLTSLQFLKHPKGHIFSYLAELDFSGLSFLVKDYSPVQYCDRLVSFRAVGLPSRVLGRNVHDAGRPHTEENKNNVEDILTFLLPSSRTLQYLCLRNNAISSDHFKLLVHFLYSTTEEGNRKGGSGVKANAAVPVPTGAPNQGEEWSSYFARFNYVGKGALQFLDLSNSIQLSSIAFMDPMEEGRGTWRTETGSGGVRGGLTCLYLFDCPLLLDYTPLRRVGTLRQVYLSSPAIRNLSFMSPPQSSSWGPSSSSSFTLPLSQSLIRVCLIGCGNLMDLSALQHLQYLTHLQLTQYNHTSSEDFRVLRHCLFLEKLNLAHCLFLKDLGPVLGSLRLLKWCVIRSCPRLGRLGPVIPISRLRSHYYSNFIQGENNSHHPPPPPNCPSADEDTRGSNSGEGRSLLSRVKQSLRIPFISTPLSPKKKDGKGKTAGASREEEEEEGEEEEDDIYYYDDHRAFPFSYSRIPWGHYYHPHDDDNDNDNDDEEYSYRVFPNYFTQRFPHPHPPSSSSRRRSIEKNGIQHCAALQILSVNDCPKFDDLSAVSLAPRLRQLSVSSTPSLQEVEPMRYCLSLEEIDIRNCPCSGEVTEEKFRHLPLIRLVQGRYAVPSSQEIK